MTRKDTKEEFRCSECNKHVDCCSKYGDKPAGWVPQKYCTKCGGKIVRTARRIPRCLHCEHVLNDFDKFCGYCGIKISRVKEVPL